jgi:hypothetical protein
MVLRVEATSPATPYHGVDDGVAPAGLGMGYGRACTTTRERSVPQRAAPDSRHGPGAAAGGIIRIHRVWWETRVMKKTMTRTLDALPTKLGFSHA